MSETSIRTTKKTREALKELREFYECNSQDEVIRHSLITLIDKNLMRTEDRATINKLCNMRQRLKPKIY